MNYKQHPLPPCPLFKLQLFLSSWAGDLDFQWKPYSLLLSRNPFLLACSTSPGYTLGLSATLPSLCQVWLWLSLAGHLVHMTVVSGSNVTLDISESLPENYKQLTWFYTFDQKIVEWDSGKSKYFESKFKGRVRLDPQSGALYISKVQKEDNSTYIMRVLKKNGNEQEWKIKLQVLGESGEPKGKSPLQWPRMDHCGFLGGMGALSGRRRGKPQDRFDSFFLDAILFGSKPRSTDPQINNLRTFNTSSEVSESKLWRERKLEVSYFLHFVLWSS